MTGTKPSREIDVTFVTYGKHPGLDPDDEPLAGALERRGFSWVAVAWDEPAAAWDRTVLAVLRSTWDYYRRRDEFLAWAERAAAVTALWNPLAVVRWNTHKSYLLDLDGRGVSIVPTLVLARGTRADLAGILDERGWRTAIVKPAVSADSWETFRVEFAEAGASSDAASRFRRLLAERDLLVQPYVASVETSGERCLVFVDGTLTHAVKKRALGQGGRHTGPEGVSAEPADDEAAYGRRAIEAAAAIAGTSGPLLYARVDLVRDERGELRLLELEATEPTLFLRQSPEAVERLAGAIADRVARARGSPL